MARYGMIGQAQGPFSSNDIINSIIIPQIREHGGDVSNPVFAKFGISIGEKDYMIFDQMEEDGKRFKFIIDFGDGEKTIWMGKTQMYESDDGIEIQTLKFPEGAPASVFVEYVVLNN